MLVGKAVGPTVGSGGTANGEFDAALLAQVVHGLAAAQNDRYNLHSAQIKALDFDNMSCITHPPLSELRLLRTDKLARFQDLHVKHAEYGSIHFLAALAAKNYLPELVKTGKPKACNSEPVTTDARLCVCVCD